jgi:hypothetical protein
VLSIDGSKELGRSDSRTFELELSWLLALYGDAFTQQISDQDWSSVLIAEKSLRILGPRFYVTEDRRPSLNPTRLIGPGNSEGV